MRLADPARFDLRGEPRLRQRRRDRRRLHLRRRGRARRRRHASAPTASSATRRIGAGAIAPALHPHRRRGARRRASAQARSSARSRGCAAARELGADVHIGNFVEVKNSTLGRGAKANHLAYLGDADVGERVNYGAGSITANYDGANKHRTTIGADAHVGSNCVLVAPVKVGDGATIGGGSTIASDAPAGQLTVARARQRRYAGWKRPTKKR